MRRADIESDLEPPLSIDRVRRFKPAPEAYQMAIDGLGLRKRSIGFAAFAGWDAAGATWFGYRTAWINRLAAPAERLDATPAIVSRGIEVCSRGHWVRSDRRFASALMTVKPAWGQGCQISRAGAYASLGPNFQIGNSTRISDVLEVALRPI